MLTDRNVLIELVQNRYHSEKLRLKYGIYIDALVERGVPPILSFRHFADIVQVSPATLHGMAFESSLYYKIFAVPKRSGGIRTISAPYQSMDALQRWIAEQIIRPAHPTFLPCVVGYVSGRSIVDHVTPHVDSKCLIKFDLKDFFPSIDVETICSLFMDIGYTRSVSRTIAALVTMNGSLPQGASTSPILSNIFLREFDAKLSHYCEELQFKYTRYADDIVVSGDNQLLESLSILKRIFSDFGLHLNHAKTRMYKMPSQVRFVTGLIIENGKIRLPKEMRRRIRAQCHLFSIGIDRMLSGDKVWQIPDPLLSWRDKDCMLDPTYPDRLLGRLNYWLHIEPNNMYAQQEKERLLKRLETI